MHFIGNQKTVEFLNKSLKNAAFNHAYIFAGPQGVGKTTLAKIFAQALIAGASELEMDIEKQDTQALFDLIFLEPETVELKGKIKQRDIPIEAVRQVQQALSLFPHHGKFKVLVVKDAQKLNGAAQNALLKLLEEPNATSILILVVSEMSRILPTVQSRCEKLNFSLVLQVEMKQAFEREKNFASDIPVLAMGRPALAKKMLENPLQLEAHRQVAQQLEKLRYGSLNDKLQLAEEFSKDTAKTLAVLDNWTWLLREQALTCTDEAKRIELYQLIEKITARIPLLKNTNANSRLLLEVLFLEM
ncbi:MAG: AAA family ATPase [Candidatus Moraniibacteriota bacterium]